MLAKSWQPPRPRIVIVGGGLAGLSAAVALSGRDLQVTLFESRPRLGGRACSFFDPVVGQIVDNCQHVTMGCCTNLEDFCQRVGISDRFRPEPVITFLSPEGRVSELRAGWLPAPLHFTRSFLEAHYLSRSDKLRIARGMAALIHSRARSGESFGDWLWRHGQNVRTIMRFWGLTVVSALNVRPEELDFGHARKLFLEGFLRSRDSFLMKLPRVPLGELYGTHMETWLAERNVTVRLKTGVRSIDLDVDAGLNGVVLRSGETVPADFVLLAVPFGRVLDLLPPLALEQLPGLPNKLAAMKSSPITGIHLWFDRPVCPYRHVALVGRLAQWVFDHSETIKASSDAKQYLQVVISASDDLAALDNRTVLDLVLADLREIWPAVGEAQLVHGRVVTEHTATFASRPGVDRHRPAQRTALDGLFLAGDWTATGWPATMEGAVRAGRLAAQGTLWDLGCPDYLVTPDLHAGLLSRLLLGPSGHF